MKWFFIIVVILVAGWEAAVFFSNRGSAKPIAEVHDSLQNWDSLQAKTAASDTLRIDSVKKATAIADTSAKNRMPATTVDTKAVQPQAVVAFAKTQIGVPYLYGSTDPSKGFDCSGFITYVFNHFGVVVPRSSIDFTNVGKEVSAPTAKEGDLILFTGTDSTEKFVGHMGIVIENSDSLRFIHSSSGKAKGVTITALNNYYKGRYVKTIRIFPENK